MELVAYETSLEPQAARPRSKVMEILGSLGCSLGIGGQTEHKLIDALDLRPPIELVKNTESGSQILVGIGSEVTVDERMRKAVKANRLLFGPIVQKLATNQLGEELGGHSTATPEMIAAMSALRDELTA